MAPLKVRLHASDILMTGVVKWFDVEKGFGNITPDDGGEDVYVHYSEIVSDGFKSLEEGQRVEFLVNYIEGGWSAVNVTTAQQQPQLEEVGNASILMTGAVAWFDDEKGFGYITPDDGSEYIFVYYSAILSDGFESLKEGQRVEFQVKDKEGKRSAVNVTTTISSE